MSLVSHSALMRHGSVALGVALAVAIRWMFHGLFGDLFPFATVFVVVLASATFGGLGTGVTATVLGALASAFFLLPPHGSFAVDGRDNQIRLILFVLVGLAISAVGGRARTMWRHAETALAEAIRQREELRTTLASIGDAVIVTDGDGRVTLLNGLAERLTGWATAEAKGRPLKTVFFLVNETTREPVEGPVTRVLREGKVVGHANRNLLVARDGSERPIDDTAAQIWDLSNHLVGVVLVFRDVTERRLAERTLQGSENRHRLLTELSSDFTFSMRFPETGLPFVEFITDGFVRITGFTLEELEARGGWLTIVHPDDQPMTLRTVEKGKAGENDDAEVRLLAKFGEIRWVRYVTQPTFDGAGRATHLLGAAQDVTRRRETFDSLRDSERELQQLADSMPQIVYVSDPHGNIEHYNRRWFEYTGLKPEDGNGWREVVHPDDWQPIADQWAAAQASGREFQGELRIRNAAGEFRWHLSRSVPRRDAEGRIARWYGTSTDIHDLKQARESLRSAGERLSLALAAAKMGDWNWTVADDIVTLSARAAEVFGIPSRPQLTWADLQTIIVPDDRERTVEAVRRSLDNVTQYDVEYRIRRPDGREAWIAVIGRAHYGESGKPEGMFGVVRDITDRKLAELAIRESEERLRLALEAGKMGVWDWNMRTNEIRWSDNLEAVHGLSPGSFEGSFEAFQKLIHSDDRARVHDAIQDSIAKHDSYDIEFRNLWPDGTTHWMAGKGKVFVEADQPVRMIGIGMDITQRKRSEQDTRFLADASASLAALVDFASTLQRLANLAVPTFADWCAVDMVDDQGELKRVAVAHVDPGKVELAHELHRKYPPSANAGDATWRILGSGKSEIVSDITDAMLAASISEAELLRITRELGLRSYMGVPVAVRGKVLGVITFISAESGRRYEQSDLFVAEDLAHRAAVAIDNARLYQEVREADRKKDEFLAVLGHELRNPLAPITNALQILKFPKVDIGVVDQARQMMERQVQHMVRLVDDLLDVSRIVRGKVDLRREVVDLSAVVQRAVETSQPLIDAEEHRLTLELSSEPMPVHGDVVRLAQVVGNLLNNAARYTERGGSISLSTSLQGERAQIRIRDNGIGIAAEALPRIFDMFVQADRRIKAARGGMGIGLTLVKSLIELHGGTVEARSEGLGKGSEFLVNLPLHRLPAASAEPPREAGKTPNASHRRILVVDDNADAAESLAMVLSILGHEAHVAHDGPMAIEVANAVHPEIAFFDIGMPGMDGYDLARHFRADASLRHIKLIALTGWGQEEDRKRSKEAGFDAHEVKPVAPESLDQLLAKAAGK